MDVVLKLAVRDGEEAQLFGRFLNHFIETCCEDAELSAEDADAPYLMVRSDPQRDLDLKTLIFQRLSAAQAFRSGWARLTGEEYAAASA